MAGYVIAVLFCLGDNCDLLRVEPGVDYPSYDECSAATARNAAQIGEIAARLQMEEGRQGDIVCLRERLTIVEIEEDYEAIASAVVRERPEANASQVGVLDRGRKARITGVVAGTQWLRVALPNGRVGYVYGERLRKLAVAGAPTTPTAGPVAPPPGTANATSDAPSAPRSSRPVPAAPPPSEDQVTAARGPPPAAPIPGPGVRPGQEFRDCDQCPVMIALPGGNFQMGSNADPTERPAHRVRVSGFAIGKYEVTQGEWSACVAAGGCSYSPRLADTRVRLPVMNVSWDDATQYVQWLKKLTGKPYRLPSEAEWEYAARAGTSTPYPWGREIGVAKANCSGCGGAYDARLPAVVGSFAPNPWGLHDMLGGVAEWVEDCWYKTYEGAPADGAARAPARCAQHVLRGGSWKSPAADVTVSSRNFYDASVRYSANGLRVALSLSEGR